LIFKLPVAVRVRVQTLNLAGDHQSDLSVDGGIDKTAYPYPSEYHDFWRANGEVRGGDSLELIAWDERGVAERRQALEGIR
jgi:MOSC domain-containing protein YiiM